MRLSLLLVANVCATLTSACMFPFNNPRLTNSSLVADYIAELQANGHGIENDGGKGWNTIIGARTKDTIVWPNYQPLGKLVYIHYCFSTHRDFQELRDIVIDAYIFWQNKLGSGSRNQHRFDGFRHYHDHATNHHPRCYTDQNKPNWGWNPLVPKGTLVIELSKFGYSHSTVRYLDESTDPCPNRNRLAIAIVPALYKNIVLNVVHEMGHVLGLEHEHQRDDRNEHVNFDCSKLKGYEVTKEKVDRSNWGFTIDDVCKSNYLGFTYDIDWASPFDFTTDMGEGHFQTHGKPYDHDSIMQYYSGAFAGAPLGGVRDLPLVRWKNGRPTDGLGPDESNAEIIPYPEAVSDGDKKGIQFLYPWKG